MISVIIPVYNCEKYIERCLSSLANQSYKDLEIIVVDDGSTDKTPNIVKQFQHELPLNLQYHRKENGGVSSARNFGIEYANGEYIAFMDADDYVSKDYFLNIIANFYTGADIVVSNYKYIFEDSSQKESGMRYYSDFMEALLSNDGILGFVFNKVYKKDIFDNARFENDIRIYEDLLFNITISSKIKKYVFLDDNYYMYFQNESSAMHTIFHSDESRLIAEKRIIEKMREYGSSQELLLRRVYYFIWDYQLFKVNNTVKNGSIEKYYNECCNLYLKQPLSLKQKVIFCFITRFPKLYFGILNHVSSS